MFVYTVGCYPEFQYDDCFEEEYLVHKNEYTKEEFEAQCREIESFKVSEIVEHLKKNHGYTEIEVQAFVNTRNW